MSEFGDWPTELLARVIKSMAPELVCRTCGEPRRRIVEATYSGTTVRYASKAVRSVDEGVSQGHYAHREVNPIRTTRETWTDCGHDDWRPGLVLDPFGMSGTAEVAQALGRVGIEILDDSLPQMVTE